MYLLLCKIMKKEEKYKLCWYKTNNLIFKQNETKDQPKDDYGGLAMYLNFPVYGFRFTKYSKFSFCYYSLIGCD